MLRRVIKTQHDPEGKVKNLSKRKFSTDTFELLNKGLTFCPSPKQHYVKYLDQDLGKFYRRIKLKAHFGSTHNEPTIIDSLKTPNSSFTPKDVDPTILTFELAVNDDIKKYSIEQGHVKTPPRDNLTPKQRQAIQELRGTDDIIITQADKGGSTVIWGIEEYLEEAYSHLNNTAFYRELPSDPSTEHKDIINNSLDKLCANNLIDKKTRDVLKPTNTRNARFYLLPKIHKVNNPGRPVISSVNCNTSKISKYVDHYIQPLATNVRSYIRDTTDLLNKMKNIGKIPANAILVTMDVKSLYSNIRHEDGLSALRNSLNNRTIKSPDTTVLITLMDHILNLNSFSFNDKFYLQTKGCAMGTIAAPSYAIIYMGEFEEMYIYPYIDNDCLFYARYIDDVFFIYTGGETKLTNFFNFINSVHDSIKFDYETSVTSIPFLDTRIYIDEEGDIQTAVFVKPTDTHNYLHADSAHPRHLLKNLPYSQALRMRRICSQDEVLHESNNALLQQFQERGYPRDLIESQIERATNTPREQTLQISTKNTSTRIPLITTFNDSLPPLSKIIRERWSLLTLKKEFENIFVEPGLISFRRPPNIKDLICSNTIREDKVFHKNNDKKESKLCQPCNSNRCLCCKQIATTDSFQSHTTKKSYNIWHEVNCKSNFVVYLLECSLCQIQYVGKSEWPFHIRLNNYRHRINSAKIESLLPCEKHFKLNNHDFANNAKFTIIEKIVNTNNTNARNTLEKRENFWINKLETLTPNGLNTKLNSSKH